MNIRTKHRVAIDEVIRRRINACRIELLKEAIEDEENCLGPMSVDQSLKNLIYNIMYDCREILKVPSKPRRK